MKRTSVNQVCKVSVLFPYISQARVHMPLMGVTLSPHQTARFEPPGLKDCNLESLLA